MKDIKQNILFEDHYMSSWCPPNQLSTHTLIEADSLTNTQTKLKLREMRKLTNRPFSQQIQILPIPFKQTKGFYETYKLVRGLSDTAPAAYSVSCPTYLWLRNPPPPGPS